MSGFLGFDFDSREIHAVVVDEEGGQPINFGIYDLTTGPGGSFQRSRRVRDLLPARDSWLDEGVLAIGLEDVYSRHLSSVVAHKRVEGALLACLPRGIPVYPLRPQTWKELALGKSNASKEEIRAWALERFPELRFWPQGLIDALAIATATAATYRNDRAAQSRGRGAA